MPMSIRSFWNGDRVRRAVVESAATRLDNAGRVGVETARELARVDTGQMRDATYYHFDAAALTVTIYCDVSWATANEYGNSHMTAQPFIRPGIAAAAQHLVGAGGGSVMGQLGGPEGVYIP